jgi:hypothetical protein
MLNFNLVPRAFWRLGHSLEVNRGSLLDIIEIGIPYNLTTSFTYIHLYFIGIKILETFQMVGSRNDVI